jgi:hypothetical protein
LLAIPCFGFAALMLLQHIELLQSIGRQAAKADVFDGREQRLREEFGQAEALVQLAYDKVAATTSDEFFGAFAQKETLQPLLTQAELALAEFDADPQNGARIGGFEALRTELEIVNRHIEHQGQGYAREQREIENELKALEPRPSPAQHPTARASTAEPRRVAVDPFPQLFKVAADLFVTDIGTLWTQIVDRAQQYLNALADRRIQALKVDVSGRVVALVQGHPVAILALDAKDVDFIYLAIRLTLVEKHTARSRFPLIVDHLVLGEIEVPKQELLMRMVRHLGSQTQVLHVVPSHATESGAIAL